MKNLIIIAVIFFAFTLACRENGNSNETNRNTAGNLTANSTANSNKVNKPANTSIPPTTETTEDENGFVIPENGEEKAKPASGKANVQGKVLYNGQPVPNNEVKLCEKLDTIFFGCSGKTFLTKTDANGEYLLANVPPQTYEGLTVRVFNTKMYVFATGSFGLTAAKYKVEPDKTFFAPPTNLFKWDVKVQNPKPNAKIDANNFTAAWDAYPDAAYYKITLSPKDYTAGATVYSDEQVETNSFKPDKPLSNGKYTFKVKVYNASDIKLAETEKDIEFTVINGAPAGSGGSDSNSN